MNFKSIIIITCFISLLSGCTSYKKMGYLKDVETLTQEQLAIASKITPKIKPGDLLTINVNARNPTAVLPFNLPLAPVAGNGIGGIQNTIGAQVYLVNGDGTINFPVLGKLRIAGYTRAELEDMLKETIYTGYLTEEPIITVRFVNFSISVIGEVNRPGVYDFPSEKVNLLEALAMAGDLTIYGKRDNILLKRENADGRNEYVRLNLQDKDIVLSPYFYMQQNDVIYVEPNKARGNSSSIGSTESMALSVISTLITITNLLILIFR